MIKLHILNLKKFLGTVNTCTGKVLMICSDGKKVDINKQERIQKKLWGEYKKNKNCLQICLEIAEPDDYMSIVSYYAGDC